MTALLDQLRDLLLHPQLPRTPVGNLNHRGRSKGAENPNGTACPQQFFNWAVPDLVTKTSQPRNCCNRSVGIALPTRCRGGGKGKGRTHPPWPHIKELMVREEKERNSGISTRVFLSREGEREVGWDTYSCRTSCGSQDPVAPVTATGCQGERQVFL